MCCNSLRFLNITCKKRFLPSLATLSFSMSLAIRAESVKIIEKEHFLDDFVALKFFGCFRNIVGWKLFIFSRYFVSAIKLIELVDGNWCKWCQSNSPIEVLKRLVCHKNKLSISILHVRFWGSHAYFKIGLATPPPPRGFLWASFYLKKMNHSTVQLFEGNWLILYDSELLIFHIAQKKSTAQLKII